MSFLNDSFGVRLGGLRRLPPAAPPAGPGTPLNLSATAVSASQIDLAWDAVAGATSYNIYRDEPESPTTLVTLVFVSTSATNSYSDTGLQGLTRYTYWVSAVNAQGASAQSAPDTADTNAPASIIWVGPAATGDQSGSSQSNLATLATANGASHAGKMIAMAGGTYSGDIQPAASGTQGAPTIYKNVPGATPLLNGTSAFLLNISNVDWIVIDGVTIQGTGGVPSGPADFPNGRTGLCRFNGADNCTLKNSTLRYSDRTVLSFVATPTFIRVLNCEIGYAGNVADQVSPPANDVGEVINIIDGAHHILIQGCYLHHGGHNIINVGSAQLEEENHIIIKGNILDNSWDDVVPGLGGRCAAISNGARFCVFEDNICSNVLGTWEGTEATQVLKLEGEQCIARRNLLFHSALRGVGQVHRPTAVPYTHNCRTYNNSMWDMGVEVWGMDARSTGPDPSTSLSSNNHFTNNAVHTAATQPIFFIEFHSTGINGTQCHNNAYGPGTGQLRTVLDGGTTTQDLDAWDTEHGGALSGNFSTATSFGWANNNQPTTFAEATPAGGSPLIDAGQFLTTTDGADTNSTSLVVADSLWFIDGFGLIDGDTIQIHGVGTAKITAIDYGTHTLTLDTPLTWAGGVGVSLPYNGSAPDIGAVQT